MTQYTRSADGRRLLGVLITLSLGCHYARATSTGFTVRPFRASAATMTRPYYVSEDRIRFLVRSVGVYHVYGTLAAGSCHDYVTFCRSSIKTGFISLSLPFQHRMDNQELLQHVAVLAEQQALLDGQAALLLMRRRRRRRSGLTCFAAYHPSWHIIC